MFDIKDTWQHKYRAHGQHIDRAHTGHIDSCVEVSCTSKFNEVVGADVVFGLTCAYRGCLYADVCASRTHVRIQ